MECSDVIPKNHLAPRDRKARREREGREGREEEIMSLRVCQCRPVARRRSRGRLRADQKQCSVTHSSPRAAICEGVPNAIVASLAVKDERAGALAVQER
jgi:hypothetical protein